MTRRRICVCLGVVSWLGLGAAHAQLVLDRVVARVGGVAMTETDVRAAVGFGIVELPAGANPLVDGTRAMIDRRLILQEVTRFQAPAPPDTSVDEEVARMKAHAGDQYPSLTRSTGVDDARLRALARETLRIQSYVNQRFGTTVQASLQDAREYYDKHPAEFTKDGTLVPFNQVETAARTAASAERRRLAIAQWIADLRSRGDVVEVKRQ